MIHWTLDILRLLYSNSNDLSFARLNLFSLSSRTFLRSSIILFLRASNQAVKALGLEVDLPFGTRVEDVGFGFVLAGNTPEGEESGSALLQVLDVGPGHRDCTATVGFPDLGILHH